MMNFQHMAFGFLTWIAEDPLEDHGYIAHQIHWVVVHDHLPWKIEIFLRTGFMLDCGLINGRGSRILQNRKRRNHCVLHQCHLVPQWLRTHNSKTLTYTAFSSNCTGVSYLPQNSFLHRFHLSRGGFGSIFKAVQMKQPMHNVQSQLARERIPEGASILSRGLNADKNFAVFKCQHVGRSGLMEKPPMQQGHPTIRDKHDEKLAQFG
jgi:hypothetical protein